MSPGNDQGPDAGSDKSASVEDPQEQLDAYARLRARAAALLAEARQGLNAQHLQELGEKAGAEVRGLGEHSRETARKLGAVLRKDLASTAQSLHPRLGALGDDAQALFNNVRDRGGALWEELSLEAGKTLETSRDRGAATLASVARAIGEWSRQLGDRLDSSLAYRTGEMTHGGSFACSQCGQAVVLKRPGHLPPCPKCHGTDFRRA